MKTIPQEIKIESNEINKTIDHYKARKQEISELILMYSAIGASEQHEGMVKVRNTVSCLLEELLNIEVIINHLNNIDYGK